MPDPKWSSGYPTDPPATPSSEALERDRAVDETGHQIAVFGRIGSRPFQWDEMKDFYLDDEGEPWRVTNPPD